MLSAGGEQKSLHDAGFFDDRVGGRVMVISAWPATWWD
ncbi:hypothetical protein C3B79_0753 [Aeromonas hydrophila]|nr:hypothetical protein C3B79_0753 [Aeromonas hydrophila]